MKTLKKFNVISHQYNKLEQYDVLPYFRNAWKNSKGYYDDKKKKILSYKQESKRKQEFRQYIIDISQYQFWGRCEYECLIGHWPFGSYKFIQEMKIFLTPEFNIDDIKQRIDFENIIISDMNKIDIHEQIMMNIDIIVDILYTEFKLDKIKSEAE